MLKRFFARLFGRRTESAEVTDAPRAAVPAIQAPPARTMPPPPPPPPPAVPVEPEVATPSPLDLVGAAPPEGHIRLILSDGTVVDPPVDADFEERLRYLSENVLKRRDRPPT
jgi:hypothetical protein